MPHGTQTQLAATDDDYAHPVIMTLYYTKPFSGAPAIGRLARRLITFDGASV